MKRFPFLQVAVIVALMVTIVSCGMPMNTQGGYYEEAPTARNSYYGNNVIVVERDPFTGQYYQVSPYGTYSTPYGYSSPYDSRYYNTNRYRNNTTYSRNRQVYQQQPRQQEQPRVTSPQERDEARKRILGKKEN
jgi:hypothetical protein